MNISKLIASSLILAAVVSSPVLAKEASNSAQQPAAGYSKTSVTTTKSSSYGQYEQVATPRSTSSARSNEDIVDLASDNGSFTTLISALKAAGLSDTLKTSRDFTVFAPNDEAFAKLPAGTLENLLKPENKIELIRVLSYHIVPGRVSSNDVVKMNQAMTTEGQNVTVAVKNNMVMINDADVIKTDINARNGVIHVIDKVLLPQ